MAAKKIKNKKYIFPVIDKAITTNMGTFIVVDSEGLQLERKKYDDAFREAEKLCDNGSSDVKILQVVKAWSVEYPEEPSPEAYDLELGDIV